MQWKKLGCIFKPDNHTPWMVTHAEYPYAMALEGSVYRIYFSCRNLQGQSSIGYVDIDLTDPYTILNISQQPVLSPGEIGLFDDSGVSLGCFMTYQGAMYLYYMGWKLAVTVPCRNSIGLAIRQLGSEHFERISLAPILDRSDVDPYALSYPFVLQE